MTDYLQELFPLHTKHHSVAVSISFGIILFQTVMIFRQGQAHSLPSTRSILKHDQTFQVLKIDGLPQRLLVSQFKNLLPFLNQKFRIIFKSL